MVLPEVGEFKQWIITSLGDLQDISKNLFPTKYIITKKFISKTNHEILKKYN